VGGGERVLAMTRETLLFFCSCSLVSSRYSARMRDGKPSTPCFQQLREILVANAKKRGYAKTPAGKSFMDFDGVYS